MPCLLALRGTTPVVRHQTLGALLKAYRQPSTASESQSRTETWQTVAKELLLSERLGEMPAEEGEIALGGRETVVDLFRASGAARVVFDVQRDRSGKGKLGEHPEELFPVHHSLTERTPVRLPPFGRLLPNVILDRHHLET